MKPRSGLQKSSPRASFIEAKWKPVLDRFEVSKQRRGKAMEKQGLVADLSFEDGIVTALIQGPKMRFASKDYIVSIPFVCRGEKYQSKIAELLYQRPDWLASLLCGEWDKEFWDELSGMELNWYPSEAYAADWLGNVTCTCKDPEMPCFHAAAALFALLHEMSENPFVAFSFLGIKEQSLLDSAHHQESHDDGLAAVDDDVPNENITGENFTNGNVNQGSAILRQEEEMVYRETSESTTQPIRHRLPPNWDQEKRAAWRERYMAWE